MSTDITDQGNDPCPSGWHTSDDVDNCYQIRLHDGSSSYGLAAITSQQEDSFLIDLLMK